MEAIVVHIRATGPDKVTVEYTPEELFAVENDLGLFSNILEAQGEQTSQATDELLFRIRQYRQS
jgi:hypothetical protein